VGLPLHRHLDVPVFIGANVMVDIEPLMVMWFDLDYPLHGYCHTLLVGGLVGLSWAALAYPFRDLIGKCMGLLCLPYATSLRKMVLSGVTGAWLHVLFDAVLYRDVKPLYPLEGNPILGLASTRVLYGFCAACFLPALAIYLSRAFLEKSGRSR
jgi:membrane-bound metal-dependent hydrolase YbcI (DUF457 family)